MIIAPPIHATSARSSGTSRSTMYTAAFAVKPTRMTLAATVISFQASTSVSQSPANTAATDAPMYARV
jgi:hypothetical protein